MVQLPKVLQKYQIKARQLLKTGAVKDVEFSGPTYQVLVEETPREPGVWAFMQLDETGSIKDYFCGCDEADEGGGCRHLAAAYLRIFDQNATPLHQRFERSLWHILCSHYAEKIGYDADQLRRSADGSFEFRSLSGKLLFGIKGLSKSGKASLNHLLERRVQETEETSLKFSNLSQTEIQLWREGRPSLDLLYHLSFWNDLARWMMILQDREAYRITFDYSSQGIPNYLKVDFSELRASFYVPEALLPPLIPALGEAASPIPVKDYAKEAISQITYDEETACLIIHRPTRPPKPQEFKGDGIRLGEWMYSRDNGFVHTEVGSMLSRDKICGHDIAELLRSHYLFVQDKLAGVEMHPEPVDVSYHLSFDSDWSLHIRAYLFEPGDLQQPRSRCFGCWAYLQGGGFYRLRNMRSQEAEEVVLSQNVSDFVTQNRVWLAGQEGFSPHLANVESELTYEVDAEGNLHFTSYTAPEDTSFGQRDFGRWLYLVGQGFFAKVGSHIGVPVRPGVTVRTESVGHFVQTNREELQLVPRFFTPVCPIVRSQLRIELKDDGIYTTPIHEFLEPYRDNPGLRFFGDYVYTPGEGFSILPPDSRLPEEYRVPVHVELGNEAAFLSYELDRLQPYIAYIDPRLHKPNRMDLVAEEAEIGQQGKGWYFLRLSYHTESGTIPVTHLWKALTNKQRFLFSDAGMIDLQDNRFAWLRNLNKQRVDLRRNSLTLSTMELIRLNVFDEVKATSKHGDKAEVTRTLLSELTTFEDPDTPNLTGLSSTLRPYQEKGVQWLWFLYHHGLSGLLCDDMGLGKTHQSMALIAAIRNDFLKRQVGRKPKVLVICPTSVLYHWEEKLHQFLPGSRVHLFYGLERSLEAYDEDSDVLLTSYGIWRREVQRLKELKFDLAIFDEIQAAKSQASRLHHSLLRVDAGMRLGLTGTPIENHLMELKSLFDLVLPTYMPSENEYREFFLKPIEKEQNLSRRHMLTRLIKPFIMRRKKEDVLTDLPEKTEEVAHCELSPEQRQLYREVLDQGRQQLISELNDSERVIPYVHIFAILTQLKRICNHPAVFLKTPEEYRKHESGKWDLFVELLSEARDSGQKVVIFSQYLAMLDIFEEYLKAEGISFASIRGSTQDRGEQLRLFNQEPNCEVFLGSLQAVGLGVDLTAASVVIHYDRWWNAARENQATDRVHRIGQRRGVQVFKLVTKGTFEERIDALINAKGQLMEDVVGVDDQDIIKRLDRRELIELLQYVDTVQ